LECSKHVSLQFFTKISLCSLMNHVLEKIAHTMLKGHKEELQRNIDLSV
jgi:hypothetical protein